MTDTTARANEGAPETPQTAPPAESAPADPLAVLAKEASDLKDRLLRTLAAGPKRRSPTRAPMG